MKTTKLIAAIGALIVGLSSAALAEGEASASQAVITAENMPIKTTSIPETTNGVPHTQIGISANLELSESLINHVAQFLGVNLGPTRVSLPGGIGFQLDENMPLARPNVIVGGREFAHLHTDGSLHASLEPEIAIAAIKAGWAVAHPWANQRPGWEGFVMIFTPTTDSELEVVKKLVESSYSFVTGKALSF